MKRSRIVTALFAGVLAAAGADESPAQVAVGATIGWGWPGYGTYAAYRCGPYGFGWSGPWGPCSAGAWADDPYLRRAIQRELAQLEYQRELDERAQRAFQPQGTRPWGARGDWPPPTPEAQVQPAYRGSGEIRPEFSGSGQPRDAAADLPR